MGKSLLIIGAGGHAKVTAEAAGAMKDKSGQSVYHQIDFLDDNLENAAGKITDLERLGKEYDEVFCGIGDNALRKRLLEQTEDFGFCIPSIVHPTAYISPSASVGRGTVIEPRAVVNANTIVGDGCIISVGAVLDHDVTVGPYAHVNAAAVCKARSRVGAGVKIDAGVIVEEP